MKSPQPAIVTRVEKILGEATIAWTPVNRGYTPAQRWLVKRASGAVFVKCAVTPLTANWLRREFDAYQRITGAFLPTLIGWQDDAENPILVIEDLSQAHWPPPWTRAHIDRVLGCIEEMHAMRPQLSSYLAVHGPMSGWNQVAADPKCFLSLNMASSRWLEKALPMLTAAEAAVSLTGSSLTHWDIRSDNLCITQQGAKLVDWSAACLSNPKLDLAFWLPSLEYEGGPPPEVILPEEPAAAAWVSGFFAARAGLPGIVDAPFVRRVQREQLSTAIAWAARALHLSRPSDSI